MAALYLHTFYNLFSHSLSLPSQNESLLLLWGQKPIKFLNTRTTSLTCENDVALWRQRPPSCWNFLPATKCCQGPPAQTFIITQKVWVSSHFFLRELNARLMWPDLTIYQSFKNQEKWRYSRSILGMSLCFGREFHVTINLSKSQEAQKVESVICIHSKSRHKRNVYISISA